MFAGIDEEPTFVARILPSEVGVSDGGARLVDGIDGELGVVVGQCDAWREYR